MPVAFFLCAAKPVPLSGLSATHPPLEERLRCIYGCNIGLLDASLLDEPRFSVGKVLPDLMYLTASSSATSNSRIASAGIGISTGTRVALACAAATDAGAASMIADATLAATTTEVTSSIAPMRLPPVLRLALHDPPNAGALMHALLRNVPARVALETAYGGATHRLLPANLGQRFYRIGQLSVTDDVRHNQITYQSRQYSEKHLKIRCGKKNPHS